jgi:hypothetical protein
MKNYLKTLTCIAISISTTFASFAQSSYSSSTSTPEWTKKNTAYFTANAISTGLNYGRLVSVSDNGMVNFSGGIGSGFLLSSENSLHGVIEVSYLSKKKVHHFEPGIGALVALSSASDDSSNPAIFFGYLGYRYQKPTGGLMIKAGVRGHYIPGLNSFFNAIGSPGTGFIVHTIISPTFSIGYAF